VFLDKIILCEEWIILIFLKVFCDYYKNLDIMAFKKQKIIGYISDNLAFSSKSIALENAIGLFDNNRIAQDFFAGLFAIVFGYKNLKELDKLNGIVNYPAIDLGDDQAKIAFQITTNSDSEKIKDTIQKFINHKLYESYERLIVFIIGEKKAYRTIFNTQGKVAFDQNNDIWDDNFLIKEIEKLELEKLEMVQQFLEDNIVEFKFPDRVYDQDIKSCIEILKRDISDFFNNKELINKGVNKSLYNRNEGFMEKKNEVNNISWDFFKTKIRGHLQYNKAINSFLSDPINQDCQNDYFFITSVIQNFYQQNKGQFSSFEDIFRVVFEKLKTYDDEIDNNKIKIILHNMYFNCDIGVNPIYHD